MEPGEDRWFAWARALRAGVQMYLSGVANCAASQLWRLNPVKVVAHREKMRQAVAQLNGDGSALVPQDESWMRGDKAQDRAVQHAEFLLAFPALLEPTSKNGGHSLGEVLFELCKRPGTLGSKGAHPSGTVRDFSTRIIYGNKVIAWPHDPCGEFGLAKVSQRSQSRNAH